MPAVVSLLRGQLAEAMRVSGDAVRLADQSPGRRGYRYPVHAARGFILVELDRLDDARSTLDTGTRISEELGIRWHLPSYQIVRVFEHFTGGEWDDAIAEIEASIELADETGETFSLILGRSVLSLISLHRNDLTRAAAEADAAARQLAEHGARYRAQWAPWARALLLEANGKIADALGTLAECWDRCARSGHTLEYRVIGADLVRLALAAGETGRARDVSASVAELAARNNVSSLTGAALRCRGLLDDDAEVLLAATDAYAARSRPLELALVSEEAGAAFARKGRADRASPSSSRPWRSTSGSTRPAISRAPKRYSAS